MTNKKCYSGIYPEFAVTNNGTSECGIGAVAEFGGKLYFNTYAASMPRGSDDGLYIIDSELNMTRSEKSAGGTDADRFIHTESGQLIIGCYFIDRDGNIRVIDPKQLVGRLTGAAYSLDEPEKYVYINTMEDGIYRVNVDTLEFTTLRCDRFDILHDEAGRMANVATQLPGEHAKGGYSAQGVYVTSNNGIGGGLVEWDGRGDAQKRESWKIVDRNKYTEVTTLDGVNGNRDSKSPIYALGWDEASVLLRIRTADGWTRLRLPKASYTQDADHGWYTEWPRIRRVGGRYLMCMHGMFWEFPENFTQKSSSGLKPLSRHLKMIVDFEDFDGRIVFACDDASVMQNPHCGRSQSNLWFTDNATLDGMSSANGFGGACVHRCFETGEATEPFFIGGFEKVALHISNASTGGVNYHIEGAKDGELDKFEKLCDSGVIFDYKWLDLSGCGCDWIRVRPTRNSSDCSIYFHLSNDPTEVDEKLTNGLHKVGSGKSYSSGILYPLDDESLTLGIKTDRGSYTWNGVGDITPCPDLPNLPEPTPDVYMLENSVMIIDRLGVKRHLPIASDCKFAREIREVVTERNLLNVGGTVYELPRDSSLGATRMKPITSHGLEIADFASFRGMLVLSGVDFDAVGEHIVGDGEVKLWAGNVDDLWKLGRPVGRGGATVDTPLYPGEAGDPFLFYGYDKRSVELSHDSSEAVTFTLEADFMGDGTYGAYGYFTVKPGEKLIHEFPNAYDAHWMRVRVDKPCRATAMFDYR